MIIRHMENVKRTKIKLLKIKTTMYEVKIFKTKTSAILDITEERGELEDRIEIIQNKTQKKKGKKKDRASLFCVTILSNLI